MRARAVDIATKRETTAEPSSPDRKKFAKNEHQMLLIFIAKSEVAKSSVLICHYGTLLVIYCTDVKLNQTDDTPC
jgi:hypothetical protein